MDANELQTLLGANLRARRKELGITQTELAEATGVTQATISLLEQGKSAPSFELLAKLGEALSIAPATLIASGNFSVPAI